MEKRSGLALELVGRLAIAVQNTNASFAKACADKAADVEDAAYLARDLAFLQIARGRCADDLIVGLARAPTDDSRAFVELDRAMRKAERADKELQGLPDEVLADVKGAQPWYLYADALLDLAVQLQGAAWRLRSYAPVRRIGCRGRPPARAWEECCVSARAAGVTAMQLARAALSSEWIRIALDLGQVSEDVLRKRFDKHWPRTAAAPKRRKR